METISAQTEALWNQELSVIDLPGAAEQDKIVFYTALYHSFLLPRSLSEDGNTEVRLMEKYIRVSALRTILYGTHSERPILCSYY